MSTASDPGGPGVYAVTVTLDGRRFRAGDRIRITVTERHRRAERIVLYIRRGHIPRARLRR